MCNKRTTLCALALGFLLLAGSCREERLPTVDLVINGVTIRAEVARTYLEKEKGLMYRRSLEEREAMLFVYTADERLSFWMKNTYLPLSVAFITAEGEITQIEDMQPLDETTIRSRRSVRYALEANQGAFARWGAKPGDVFVFPKEFLD
jgi:uncharacterized protein